MNIENSLEPSDRVLLKNLKFSFDKEKETTTPDGFESLPKAAVSAILRNDKAIHELVILLLKRNIVSDDPWSGHMALPGGRYIDLDGKIISTAARETKEETGIDILQCEILGTLHEVVSTNLLVRVTPFVVMAPENTDVRLDPGEIERSFWIPLSYFRDHKNITPYEVIRFGVKSKTPSYKFLGDYVIWGMTFRIIRELIERMQ